jgi:hypothetical protein
MAAADHDRVVALAAHRSMLIKPSFAPG